MPHFAVRMEPGPGWDHTRSRRRQEQWDEHAEFMDSLVVDGFVLIGGPMGPTDLVLLAVEAADEPDVRARLATDPWAAPGVMTVASVEPWSLWLVTERLVDL